MDLTHASPIEVVQSAVAALEGERWAEILPLVRAESIQRLRDSTLRWLVEEESRPARTADDVRAEQPWLPPEVAAFYAEQEERGVTAGLPGHRAQWGVSSFRELEALSPEDFFIRYLATSSPSAKLRMALATSPRPPRDDIAAQIADAAARPVILVLGAIMEGDRQAHVLYRESHPADEHDGNVLPGDVRVTTLDLVDGRWWLRIDHTLLDRQGWTVAWTVDPDGSADDA
jgi:hypothetical protein